MILEDLPHDLVGPIASGFITAVVGANAYFIRWLVKSFEGLRADLKEQAKSYTDWLNAHEDLDQHRHEENLHRFEKISVALARLGSTNGTHEKIQVFPHIANTHG